MIIKFSIVRDWIGGFIYLHMWIYVSVVMGQIRICTHILHERWNNAMPYKIFTWRKVVIYILYFSFLLSTSLNHPASSQGATSSRLTVFDSHMNAIAWNFIFFRGSLLSSFYGLWMYKKWVNPVVLSRVGCHPFHGQQGTEVDLKG